MYLCIENVRKLFRADLDKDALLEACRPSGRCLFQVTVYDLTSLPIDSFSIGAFFSNTQQAEFACPLTRDELSVYQCNNDPVIVQLITYECPFCPKYIQGDRLHDHINESHTNKEERIKNVKNKLDIEEGALKFWKRVSPKGLFFLKNQPQSDFIQMYSRINCLQALLSDLQTH